MATVKTAEDYASDLGKVQLQYQQAKAAGQDTKPFEQQGQLIRQLASAAGQDISKLGATNNYGQDYTGLIKPDVQAQIAPQNTGPSFVDQQTQRINDIYNNQHASQLQALRQQQQTALQGLNKVETQAKQSAYDNRNQADTANMQAAQRLREAMANMGLTNSGDNLTNISQLNAAKQSALGQINQQETNALTDVAERRGIINNNAAGNELALMQALQAEQARQLLDLGYRAEDINFRNNQFDWTKGMDLAGLTGNYNGQRTLAGQQFDYNTSPNNPANQAQIISNQINKLKLENLPEEMKLGLEQLRQNVAMGKLDYQQAQYQLNELTDPNSVTNRAKALSLEAQRLGNAELQKRIDQIGKEPVLSEYDQQVQALKLEQLKAEVDRAKNPPVQVKTAEDVYKMIDDSKYIAPEYTTDRFGQTTKTGKIVVTDPVGLEKYILALGLSDAEAKKLYYRYGLEWGG